MPHFRTAGKRPGRKPAVAPPYYPSNRPHAISTSGPPLVSGEIGFASRLPCEILSIVPHLEDFFYGFFLAPVVVCASLPSHLGRSVRSLATLSAGVGGVGGSARTGHVLGDEQRGHRRGQPACGRRWRQQRGRL